MNTPHKHRDLIIAWANGAAIEFQNNKTGSWAEIKNPSWKADSNYRIKPTTTYKMGERFKGPNGDTYILAQVDTSMMALVSLSGGNRWINPVKVSNVMNVSEEEFSHICNGKIFTKE